MILLSVLVVGFRLSLKVMFNPGEGQLYLVMLWSLPSPDVVMSHFNRCYPSYNIALLLLHLSASLYGDMIECLCD